MNLSTDNTNFVKQRRASNMSINIDERIVTRIKNYWTKTGPLPLPNIYKLITGMDEDGSRTMFEI